MSTLEVSIRVDLVVTGITEDGEQAIGNMAYLVVEDADGSRWAHFHCVTKRYEKDAIAALAGLEARVNAHLARGGQLADAHWTRIEPRYGSEAYEVVAATGFFRARERFEAHQAGEPVNLGEEAADALFA